MAAGAGGIRAGRAFVELFADDTKLVRGLRSAQKRLQTFGASVTKLGAGMFAAGAAVAFPFLATISDARDAEKSLGRFNAVFGKEAAAAGRFAERLAADVGRAATDVRDSMAKTQAQLTGLSFDPATSRQMSESLQSLALDFASFHGLSDEEAGDRLRSALSGSRDALQGFGVDVKAAAVDQQLLAMGFNATSATATEQQKAMARLAIIMESLGEQGVVGDAIKNADSYDNQMKRLDATFQDVRETIGSAVLPVLTPLLEHFAAGAQLVAGVIAENKEFIALLFKIALGVMAAGAALMAVGGAISALGFVFGALATVVTTVGAVIGFLLSPLGLVVALLAGLAAWLVKSGHAAEWLASTFGPLMEEATAAFDAIKTALKAGDFGAAAQVLWTTLRYWFTKGVDWLTGIWIGFKRAFLEIFLGLASEGAKLLTGVWSAFQSGIQSGLKMLDVAQTQTANKLLTWAGEDGPLGDVARLIVGADLRGEGQVEAAIAASNEIGQADLDARDAALARLEADRQAALDEIDDQLGRDLASMHAGLDDQLRDSADAVTEARKEMDAAIAAAREAGERTAEADGTAGDEVAGKLIDALKLGAAGAVTAPDTSGTFSTLADRIFLGRGADERIADATEETARNTRKIARDGGLAFQA